MKSSTVRVWLALGCAVLLATPGISAGQHAGEPITIGHVESVHSKILNEDRDLMIYRHPDYDEAKIRYPVLYLLDTDDQFHQTVGTIRHLTNTGVIPKLIVVGIRNTDRWRDMTPPGDKGLKEPFPSSGGGDRFIRFIKEELVPHIDNRYRTMPYRILSGHSLGGLMAVYAFLNEPELFQSHLVIDPSLWWNDLALVKQATSFFDTHKQVNAHMYLTVNNNSSGSVAECWTLAHNLWNNAPNGRRTEGLRIEIHPMDGVNHGTIPHRSTHDGLQAFFEDWYIAQEAIVKAIQEEGLAGVDRLYEELSKQKGFLIPPSESDLTMTGNILIDLKRHDEAVATFERLVDSYPESVDALRAAGSAYERLGNNEKALSFYERALAKAEKGPHMNLPSTREMLRQFKRKMEAQEQK